MIRDLARRFILFVPKINPWRLIAFAGLWCAEMSWVALWYSGISPGNRPVSYGRAFLILGGFYVLANLLTRLLNDLDLRVWVRRTVLGLALLASLYAALLWMYYSPQKPGLGEIERRIVAGFASPQVIPSEFWVLLVVLLVFRRGINLERQGISSDSSSTLPESLETPCRRSTKIFSMRSRAAYRTAPESPWDSIGW